MFGVGFVLFMVGFCTAIFCGMASANEPDWVKVTGAIAVIGGAALMVLSAGVYLWRTMP